MWLLLPATAHLTQFVFHFHSEEHLTKQFPRKELHKSQYLLSPEQCTGFHLAYKDQ